MNNKTAEKQKIVDMLLSARVIAILRGQEPKKAALAAKAAYLGGVRAVEVTFSQDGDSSDTLRTLCALKSELGNDVAIGVGTVLNVQQLKAAYENGAQFMVAPNTDKAAIELSKALGMACIPGAMTPTEIQYAYSLGADVVKVFPAGALGVDYFRSVRAPLKHIPMAAVAGITPDNIREFYDAGACAFGISTGIFKTKLMESGSFDEITKLAAEFIGKLD